MDFSFLEQTKDLAHKARALSPFVPPHMNMCPWHRQQDKPAEYFSGYIRCQCELCLLVRSYLVWRAWEKQASAGE